MKKNNMFKDTIQFFRDLRQLSKNADDLLESYDKNYKINNPSIVHETWISNIILNVLTDKSILDLCDDLKEKLGEDLTRDLIETLTIKFSTVFADLIAEQNQVMMDNINKRFENVHYKIRHKIDDLELRLKSK